MNKQRGRYSNTSTRQKHIPYDKLGQVDNSVIQTVAEALSQTLGPFRGPGDTPVHFVVTMYIVFAYLTGADTKVLARSLLTYIYIFHENLRFTITYNYGKIYKHVLQAVEQIIDAIESADVKYENQRASYNKKWPPDDFSDSIAKLYVSVHLEVLKVYRYLIKEITEYAGPEGLRGTLWERE